jgi:ribosomal-protein-alanine N-acetyltransferase
VARVPNGPATQGLTRIPPDPANSYRVTVYGRTAPDAETVAQTARLVSEAAQRGEALGVATSVTEHEYALWLRELIARAAAGDAALAVATAPDGAVVGTAQWTRSEYRTQRVLAVMDRVAVAPSRRGGGIAAALVRVEVVELTARGNNHTALHLYQRLGFERVGVLPNVVAVGDVRHDAVVMCRQLPRPASVQLLGEWPAGAGASLPRGTGAGPDWQRTERLLLCRPRLADADAFFAVHADPQTNLYNPYGPLTDPAEAVTALQDWIGHWQDRGFGYWTVRDPADGAVLGFAGVKPPTGRFDFVNLYYRFRPSAWGRGYATEAGRAALQLAAEHAPGVPVAALIRPSNLPSVRVAERLGMAAAGEEQRETGVYAKYVLG